jgi:hypothetical protein
MNFKNIAAMLSPVLFIPGDPAFMVILLSKIMLANISE